MHTSVFCTVARITYYDTSEMKNNLNIHQTISEQHDDMHA